MTQIRNYKVKTFIIANDVILNISDPTFSTTKILEFRNTFSEAETCKI